MTTTARFKASICDQTPQAKDDNTSPYEDRVSYFSIADLMLNDKGGAADAFYGLDQNAPLVASAAGFTATSKLGAALEMLTGTKDAPVVVSQFVQRVGEDDSFSGFVAPLYCAVKDKAQDVG